jgi:hypothetical protein
MATPLTNVMHTCRQVLAGMFSLIFLTVAVSLALLSAIDFVLAFRAAPAKELIGGIVSAINTAFISLATYELGVGIGKEYASPDNGSEFYPAIRRNVTRFVSVACIALVLEALILVIKYSQLELAGNLYYPVAIVVGASVLLTALGLFIHLSRPCSGTACQRAFAGAADRQT